jgi:subtilisin family serine protease
MIRAATIFLAACLILGCTSNPVRIESRALGNQVSAAPDRYIIAAVDNNPVAFVAHAGSSPRGYDSVAEYGPSAHARQVMHAVEQEYGLKEVSAWPIEALHMHCAVLEVPPGADRASLIAKLSQDSRVRLSQPMQSFQTRTDVYNDPYVGLQRGFQQMDVAGAHPISRGEGVKIALIDTGVDTAHPDLKGAVVAAENFVDADASAFQKDRHGTEMAGVIAAVANNGEGIVGVAPAAHLLAYKACWQTRPNEDAALCNSFTLARALAAAFDAHAQIINMSLAGPADPLVGGLIREGLRRGVLFVGAAEAGIPGVLHQPGVIEVASAEAQTPVDGAVSAPGREILTLLPGGHYDFASGVSIATAQVSGVVALMLAKNPSLGAAAAARLLRDTSSTGGAESARGVDACAALVMLSHQGSCRARTDGEINNIDEHSARFAAH